jgi:hypothetical protein
VWTPVLTATVDGHLDAPDHVALRIPAKADDGMGARHLPSWRFVTARRAFQEHSIRAELRQHVVPMNAAHQPSQAGNHAAHQRWQGRLWQCHDVVAKGARRISVQNCASILHSRATGANLEPS